eukprot:COSAG01_NODE_4147_length_5298_cov_4.390460_2_plen_394_part_00
MEQNLQSGLQLISPVPRPSKSTHEEMLGRNLLLQTPRQPVHGRRAHRRRGDLLQMPSTKAEASRKMLFGDQDDDFDAFLESAVATAPSAAAASAPGTTAVVGPAPQATSSAAQQLDPLDDLFDEPKPAAGTPPRAAAANHALAAAVELVHMDSISLDEPEPAPPLPPPQQQPSARNALAALPSAPASSGVQAGAEQTQVTDSPATPLQGNGAAAGRGAAKVAGMDVDADLEGGVGLETDNPFGLPRLTEAQRAVLQEEEGNGEGEAAEAGGVLRKGQGPKGGGGGADTGGGGGEGLDEQQPLPRPPRWMWLSASAMGDRAQAVAVEDAKVGVRYFLSGGRRAVVSSDGKLHISMGRTEPTRGSPHGGGGGGGGVGVGGRYDGRYGPAASLLGR